MASNCDKCSIVVPVFNEEAIAEMNSRKLARYFDFIFGSGNWQFVFVENGSRDSTPEIVGRLSKEHAPSKVVTLASPDYGNALRAGIAAADFPFVHIINIEQWDMPFLSWAWAHRDEYDYIVGSKRIDPLLNGQSRYRRFLSLGLNCVLQVLFEFAGTETHGPKLLRMERVRDLADQCVMSRGQFDTELTLRCLRRGLRVVEAPVAYVEERPPRNLMLRKIVQNLLDVAALARVMRGVPQEGFLRLYRVAREDLVAAAPVSGPACDPREFALPVTAGGR
ncbi:glycosyltransferase family 2 protein [Magnetospirillum sp. UT-4]|uniref:glycosyltransferase family 2 protein n=1 Tax=Magnetospirillum sp. UT-4 TaxID=2681467 RepID=UPI00138147E9|nr:glycosyltransferase family 2 protein [Magnetospirillum sp. UT-4]CAA7612130.1 putative Dolichol-P-glucose synthetase [Magnetospirillum sp. UT-4]